jgi:hypothetical protein
MQYIIIRNQHGAYLEPLETDDYNEGLPFTEARNQLATYYRTLAEEIETLSEEEYLQMI